MKNLRHSLAVGVSLFALTPAAFAQIINYGEMEELFQEAITTSATGSPLRRSEVPVTMDIITADDIRHAGAVTIPDILSRLAGIDVYHWSNDSADVAIRGLDQGASNRLMVLINGRENYTDGLGTVIWEFLPVGLDEIRQIEVIRGPNSALYGFNAAAGVINIITYNPEFDDIKAERVTVGTDGTRQGSVARTAQWDGGGIRASAGWSLVPENAFHPAYAADAEAATNPSITRTLNVDAQFKLDDVSRLRLQEAVADTTFRGMYVVPYYLRSVVVMSQGDFSTETPLGMLDLSAMDNRYQIGEFRHSLAQGKLYNELTVVKAQDLFKAGPADTFRVGLEYRRDDMPTYPVHGSDLLSQTEAASAMWEHSFTKDFSLLDALRGDRFGLQRTGPFLAYTPFDNGAYDRAIYGWSFNSALVYRPTQEDSVKLSAARGLQLPSLTEYGIMNPLQVPNPFAPSQTVSVNSIGNPYLRPTRVMHYELSYDRQFPDFDSSARVAAFHQLITGIRDLTGASLVNLNPIVLISSYGEVGGAHIDGIETDLRGRAGEQWRWAANYSYRVVTDDTSIDTYHNYSRSTPRHTANLTFGWDWRDFETDSAVRFVARTQMPEQVTFGSYELFTTQPVWAFTQRVAYKINDEVRVEMNVSSGFSDNPMGSEKRRALFSVIGNY